MKKQHLPEKTCAYCQRPFLWRKKWQRCWDEVRYCSERCKRQARIEQRFFKLLSIEGATRLILKKNGGLSQGNPIRINRQHDPNNKKATVNSKPYNHALKGCV